MHKAGGKPTIAVVKRRRNAHRKAELSTAARAPALLAPVPSRGAGVSRGKRFNGRMTFETGFARGPGKRYALRRVGARGRGRPAPA
jgi:hypothetical protein